MVHDGGGQYYAITWDDLRRHRVPAACVAALVAVVHGAEPANDGDGLRGYADVHIPSAEHTLLSEAISVGRRFRLAAQRLDAWALLR